MKKFLIALAAVLAAMGGVGLYVSLDREADASASMQLAAPPSRGGEPAPIQGSTAPGTLESQTFRADEVLRTVVLQVSSEELVGPEEFTAVAIRDGTNGRRALERIATRSDRPLEVQVAIYRDLIGVLLLAAGHEALFVERAQIEDPSQQRPALQRTPWQVLVHDDHTPIATARVAATLHANGEPYALFAAQSAAPAGLVRLPTLTDGVIQRLKDLGVEAQLAWRFEAEGYAARICRTAGDFGPLSKEVWELDLESLAALESRRLPVTVDASQVPLDTPGPIRLAAYASDRDADVEYFEVAPGQVVTHRMPGAVGYGAALVALTRGWTLAASAPEYVQDRPESALHYAFKAVDGRINLQVVPARGSIRMQVHRPPGGRDLSLRLAWGRLPPSLAAEIHREIPVPNGSLMVELQVEDWGFDTVTTSPVAGSTAADPCAFTIDVARMKAFLGIMDEQLPRSFAELGSRPRRGPSVQEEGTIYTPVDPTGQTATTIAYYWQPMTQLRVLVGPAGHVDFPSGRIAVYDPKQIQPGGQEVQPRWVLPLQSEGLFTGCVPPGNYRIRGENFDGRATYDAFVDVPEQPVFDYRMELQAARAIRIQLQHVSGESLEGVKVQLLEPPLGTAVFSKPRLVAESVAGSDQSALISGVVPGRMQVRLQSTTQSFGFPRPSSQIQLIDTCDLFIDERNVYSLQVLQAVPASFQLVSEWGEVPTNGIITLKHLESDQGMMAAVSPEGRVDLVLARPGTLRVQMAILPVPEGVQRPDGGSQVRFVDDPIIRTGAMDTRLVFTRQGP